MFGPDGTASFTTINEVVEFSQATLDPSLFDVPAGYREVQDFSSLYAAHRVRVRLRHYKFATPTTRLPILIRQIRLPTKLPTPSVRRKQASFVSVS